MKKKYFKVRTQYLLEIVVKIYDYIDNDMVLIYESNYKENQHIDDYDDINKHVKEYHENKYPLIKEFIIRSL